MDAYIPQFTFICSKHPISLLISLFSLPFPTSFLQGESERERWTNKLSCRKRGPHTQHFSEGVASYHFHSAAPDFKCSTAYLKTKLLQPFALYIKSCFSVFTFFKQIGVFFFMSQQPIGTHVELLVRNVIFFSLISVCICSLTTL